MISISGGIYRKTIIGYELKNNHSCFDLIKESQTEKVIQLPKSSCIDICEYCLIVIIINKTCRKFQN